MLVRWSWATAIYWSSIQFARRLAKRALSGSTSREEKGEAAVAKVAQSRVLAESLLFACDG